MSKHFFEGLGLVRAVGRWCVFFLAVLGVFKGVIMGCSVVVVWSLLLRG